MKTETDCFESKINSLINSNRINYRISNEMIPHNQINMAGKKKALRTIYNNKNFQNHSNQSQHLNHFQHLTNVDSSQVCTISQNPASYHKFHNLKISERLRKMNMNQQNKKQSSQNDIKYANKHNEFFFEENRPFEGHERNKMQSFKGELRGNAHDINKKSDKVVKLKELIPMTPKVSSNLRKLFLSSHKKKNKIDRSKDSNLFINNLIINHSRVHSSPEEKYLQNLLIQKSNEILCYLKRFV